MGGMVRWPSARHANGAAGPPPQRPSTAQWYARYSYDRMR